jgi:NADPH2:quinone reductase
MADPTLVLGLGGQGMTAALVLKLVGKLQPGESVLIPAAAGAVGSLAVQLAKIYGAGRVIALASTQAKRDLALSLGADAAVDYTVEGWSKAVIEANGGVGVDLALEMTGGPTFYETIQAIKAQKGRMVVFGNASDQRVTIAPDILLARNLTISGFMMGAFLDMRREVMPELMGYVREGRLKPQIGGRYALADAPAAHHAIETRASTGKILIEPWK